MPNLIDYVLENPERRNRIVNYMIGFMTVTGFLWVAAVIYFVNNK